MSFKEFDLPTDMVNIVAVILSDSTPQWGGGVHVVCCRVATGEVVGSIRCKRLLVGILPSSGRKGSLVVGPREITFSCGLFDLFVDAVVNLEGQEHAGFTATPDTLHEAIKSASWGSCDELPVVELEKRQGKPLSLTVVCERFGSHTHVEPPSVPFQQRLGSRSLRIGKGSKHP